MKSWNSFSIELTEKKAKRDYDGDGKIESGSKEHAGVVHNAIQRAKGKKADGQDTRKEEIEIEEGVRDDKTAERKARLEKKRGMKLDDHPQYKKEEVENVEELYKGKHGQSEKEYQDSRSDAGKMISGDSKTSGAAYSARGVKNTGPNPAGGSKKPQAQGRMGAKDREYLKYRKANLKKEEVENIEETKLGDKAYARARDVGAQRRRTKEYKQGLNRSTTRKEKGMYRLATAQRRTDADLERQKTTYDTGAHKGDFDRAKRAKEMKKESYTVTNADKKGNTKAYQNYKAGMKGKDGKPLYKAADHMKEDNLQEIAPALAVAAKAAAPALGKMAGGAAAKGIASKGAGIAAKGAMRKKAVDFAAKKGGEMVGNKVTNMLQGNNEEFMPEKAESKAQQRLMGLALSVQRGDTPRSSVSPEVLKMAREMKEKDLKDFAGTKHEGLPEKVKKEEPEFSSPLVESLITENIAKQMAMKAKREEQRAKSIDRKASAAQQRVGLNVKK